VRITSHADVVKRKRFDPNLVCYDVIDDRTHFEDLPKRCAQCANGSLSDPLKNPTKIYNFDQVGVVFTSGGGGEQKN
jgi:hypothetical protein